ncbi:hypothetical protein LCGC14_1351250 [marine sediment metagenome]|uniref:Uncharacterized protein n=1 Tax=marine sediment metagenome TaxID=412755 RepID=A0A0F9KX41_9ZZZZ
MNLDFSKCKTKEDVEKVIDDHKKELNLLKKIRGIDINES